MTTHVDERMSDMVQIGVRFKRALKESSSGLRRFQRAGGWCDPAAEVRELAPERPG